MLTKKNTFYVLVSIKCDIDIKYHRTSNTLMFVVKVMSQVFHLSLFLLS